MLMQNFKDHVCQMDCSWNMMSGCLRKHLAFQSRLCYIFDWCYCVLPQKNIQQAWCQSLGLVPSDEVHPLLPKYRSGSYWRHRHNATCLNKRHEIPFGWVGDTRAATYQTPGTQHETLSVSFPSILIKITATAYTGTHTQPQPTDICVLAAC